ncbi:MAG: hypothetical protein IIW16_00455 [Clostridia bacterium]|nr:hypothetical protein [Clostridia bacterium]
MPYGKLQPFGEWLQSPWATSVSEAIGALRRKNPLLSAKKDESVRKDGFFFFYANMVGFEQGGRKPLAFGRKQFRELFSPTWATSVSEAIGALRRKNPLLSAKIDKFRVRLVDFTFSLLTLHFSLFSAADFGGFFFLPFIHPTSNTQSQISVNGRFRGQKLRGLFLFF